MTGTLESPSSEGLFGYLLSERVAPASWIEILKEHQKELSLAAPIDIEKRLWEVFTPRPYALKIYRGLPRVYRRDNPAQNRVKQNFADLGALKRCAAEKFVGQIYDKVQVTGEVVLFTWMIADGWGDFIAGGEALKILRARFPHVTFRWVCLSNTRFSLPKSEALCFSYDGAEPPMLSQEVLQCLSGADLILSIPTYYPHMEQVMQRLRERGSSPALACVGQYGYIESSWFHPRSGNTSMGLHFLEKGILIRGHENGSFGSLQSEKLLHTLFGNRSPHPGEIEQYLDATRLYLAYLVSPVGGAIYLHAVLHAEAMSDAPIDICTPDLGWFIKYVEKRGKEGKPPLEGWFRVKELEVHFEGKVHKMNVGPKGKRVRILCVGHLSDADFRLLVRLSNEFVAVRGDQSFSEVVAAGKAFFYDGAPHARFFVKDLVALAENRLREHRNAQILFRKMGKAFLHNLPLETGEWVEETAFQSKESWESIARAIGQAMQDPDTLVGFKKLSRILTEEHSFNSHLCHLVARTLYVRAHPSIKESEERVLRRFAELQSTLPQTLQTIAQELSTVV